MPSLNDKRPWLSWYGTARWKRLRQWQLSQEPLCLMCLECDIVTEATVADHVEPHRGAQALFWDPDNLQSLCAGCHSRFKQQQEHGRMPIRFGADGFPI